MAGAVQHFRMGEKWARRGYARSPRPRKRPAAFVFDATTGQVVVRFDHMRESGCVWKVQALGCHGKIPEHQ